MFLIALFILVMPIIVAAQDDASDDAPTFGLVSVNAADVRTGPDFAYPTIARLERNASVVIIGRAGDFFRRWDGRQWLQIELGDQRPWIYARLLRTSVPFNSIFPTGRILPRNANGRVPEEFDLSVDVCQQWQGGFTQSGDFTAGDSAITVTYPGLQGANVYSVITISPSGLRNAFDSETTTAQILLEDLPTETGEYTWRVAPYWTNSTSRSRWQQVCLLRTGGTFIKPETPAQAGE